MILKTIMAVCLLYSVTLGQQGQTRIAPPTPNYEQYGSYSRQLRVYTNAQRELDRLDRERYRNFKREVRRESRRSRLIINSANGTSRWERRRLYSSPRYYDCNPY